jgi:hypothetical protein
MIVGSGKFRYRVNADWAKLPARWSFKEVGGVGVDSNDNVHVFNRGEHPMMVFAARRSGCEAHPDRRAIGVRPRGQFSCGHGERGSTRGRTAST